MTETTTEQTPAPKVNPLLAKLRIPGESLVIPSQGLFYTNGELSDDVVNGELHIYPLTTIDEIILRSPDKLLSGDAIKEVFPRCIPQVLKPMELYAKDVDFLLAALRKVSYGAELEVSYSHDCENAKAHEYKFDLTKIIHDSVKIDPTQLNAVFDIKLENGQVVKINPIRYCNVIKLLAGSLDQTVSIEAVVKQEITSITSIIHSVDGVTNPEFLKEWAENLTVNLKRTINKSIDKINDWGMTFDGSVKCQDCGEEIQIPVITNPIGFFM